MTAARRTRITFLGDTLVGGEGQSVLDVAGAGYAFDGIRAVLADSDLVVVNQEGPITRRDEPGAKHDTGRKRYWYRGAPESVAALFDAGIRVVSLANNHVLDFGSEGLADTIAALDAGGIEHCGAGPDRRAARRPALITVNGVRISFASFMQRYDIYVAEQAYAARARAGPARLSLERVRRDLEVVDEVDLRVALAHWGRNYRPVNGRQRRLARGIVEAGADLVIGHHPHVAQPIDLMAGVPVAFSLGNGPLGTPGRYHSGRPPYGLVLSVDLDGAGTPRHLRVVPILVDNAVVRFQPQVADDPGARELLDRLLTPDLPWQSYGAAGYEAELPVVSRPVGVPAGDLEGELLEP